MLGVTPLRRMPPEIGHRPVSQLPQIVEHQLGRLPHVPHHPADPGPAWSHVRRISLKENHGQTRLRHRLQSERTVLGRDPRQNEDSLGTAPHHRLHLGRLSPFFVPRTSQHHGNPRRLRSFQQPTGDTGTFLQTEIRDQQADQSALLAPQTPGRLVGPIPSFFRLRPDPLLRRRPNVRRIVQRLRNGHDREPQALREIA